MECNAHVARRHGSHAGADRVGAAIIRSGAARSTFGRRDLARAGPPGTVEVVAEPFRADDQAVLTGAARLAKLGRLVSLADSGLVDGGRVAVEPGLCRRVTDERGARRMVGSAAGLVLPGEGDARALDTRAPVAPPGARRAELRRDFAGAHVTVESLGARCRGAGLSLPGRLGTYGGRARSTRTPAGRAEEPVLASDSAGSPRRRRRDADAALAPGSRAEACGALHTASTGSADGTDSGNAEARLREVLASARRQGFGAGFEACP